MTQEEQKGGVYLGENGYVVNRSPNIELPFYIKPDKINNPNLPSRCLKLGRILDDEELLNESLVNFT